MSVPKETLDEHVNAFFDAKTAKSFLVTEALRIFLESSDERIKLDVLLLLEKMA